MGISIGQGETVFRCNLVAVQDGKMLDYSAGHITTEEARELIDGSGQESGRLPILIFIPASATVIF